MKKTITSIALLVSAANAHALIAPGPRVPREEPQEKTTCLQVLNQKEALVDDCDMTERNKMRGVTLTENGCAKDQVAIKSTTLEVRSCPSYAQL